MTTTVVLLIVAAALAGLGFFGYARWQTWRKSSGKQLTSLIQTISTDALHDLVIPDGAGGEIHIEHLLLTPYGLILLETKDMAGMVFAGTRMDTWSATLNGARMTFDNPLPRLQGCTAALNLLAPNTPIESRVLFTNAVSFPKGHPDAVCTVSTLLSEYSTVAAREPDQDFTATWQAIKAAASAA